MLNFSLTKIIINFNKILFKLIQKDNYPINPSSTFTTLYIYLFDVANQDGQFYFFITSENPLLVS